MPLPNQTLPRVGRQQSRHDVFMLGSWNEKIRKGVGWPSPALTFLHTGSGQLSRKVRVEEGHSSSKCIIQWFYSTLMMEKSNSTDSIEASDVDDHPSLMDMYARQLGKRESDTPPESPPPPDFSYNQQEKKEQQSVIYQDNPSVCSQRESEPVLTSDKTGFISQNETGNKHKGSSRFFSSLSKVASSAKSMVGKIASSSSSASAYFNPTAPISLANLSGTFLLPPEFTFLFSDLRHITSLYLIFNLNWFL